jgi:hypothetical protein
MKQVYQLLSAFVIVDMAMIQEIITVVYVLKAIALLALQITLYVKLVMTPFT